MGSLHLEPIPFAVIFIETNNCEYKASSDFEGITKIKIQKSKDRYSILLNYPSYKSFTTEINIDKSKEITIYLSSTNGQIQNGAIWKYKILKNDSLSLKLMDLRNENINTLIKYE